MFVHTKCRRGEKTSEMKSFGVVRTPGASLGRLGLARGALGAAAVAPDGGTVLPQPKSLPKRPPNNVTNSKREEGDEEGDKRRETRPWEAACGWPSGLLPGWPGPPNIAGSHWLVVLPAHHIQCKGCINYFAKQ